jgi:WD40 repeat protein
MFESPNIGVGLSDDSPELVVLTGHTARVLAVALSPDGTLLATSGSDGLVILWDAATGETFRIWKCADVY